MNPDRIVIDTNVFISALLNPLGTPRKAINKSFNQFTLLQSEATYQELATRISKNKFDKYLDENDRIEFLSFVQNKSLFINVEHKTTICADPDDNKFLELALTGKAKYIITGDNDLLVLKSYQDSLILTPGEFINLIITDRKNDEN
jgi:putative PIN family toxin of toxin-antitoxin system